MAVPALRMLAASGQNCQARLKHMAAGHREHPPSDQTSFVGALFSGGQNHLRRQLRLKRVAPLNAIRLRTMFSRPWEFEGGTRHGHTSIRSARPGAQEHCFELLSHGIHHGLNIRVAQRLCKGYVNKGNGGMPNCFFVHPTLLTKKTFAAMQAHHPSNPSTAPFFTLPAFRPSLRPPPSRLPHFHPSRMTMICFCWQSAATPAAKKHRRGAKVRRPCAWLLEV